MHPLGVNKVQKCNFLKGYWPNDSILYLFSMREYAISVSTTVQALFTFCNSFLIALDVYF